MNGQDTNLNNENNNNVHVTKKVIHVQTNTVNTKQNGINTAQSHDLKDVSNVHDPERYRQINNALQAQETDKKKSLLITILSLIGVALLVYLSFHAANIAKKVVEYFHPTEVNYVKEMANKLNDDIKLRILGNDTTYFIIFPSVSRINSRFIVKLDIYEEALNSKMESYSYNNELDMFMFYGDEYYTTKNGVKFNGLDFKLDEATVASMYKYEDEKELSFVLLLKLKGRDIAIYFRNADGQAENVNGYYIDGEENLKINDNLVFVKSNNTLTLGEKVLTKVV